MAGARLAAWDTRSSFVALNAVTPVLFLPAWPVALTAAILRRRGLLAAATLAVAAHVAFLLPEVLASEALPDVAPDDPRFRLVSANVYAGNDDVAGFADELRGLHADVAVLLEAGPAFLAGLDAAGALSELPYRIVVSRTDPFAAVVVSRWPLVDREVVELDGRPVFVRATLDLPGRPVRLLAVHTVAPVGGDREPWARALDAVGQAVRTAPRPVIVAGDFNATWGNRAFRRLLRTGLTDAAAARGRPFGMTWPADVRLLPPLARIDHVLTSGGVVVTSIRRGLGPGSDHRPLVAEVAVNRGPVQPFREDG